jgi:hypothetical protein
VLLVLLFSGVAGSWNGVLQRVLMTVVLLWIAISQRAADPTLPHPATSPRSDPDTGRRPPGGRRLRRPRCAVPRFSLSRLGSADPEASCSLHRAADDASHLHTCDWGQVAPRLSAGYIRRIPPGPQPTPNYPLGSHGESWPPR